MDVRRRRAGRWGKMAGMDDGDGSVEVDPDAGIDLLSEESDEPLPDSAPSGEAPPAGDGAQPSRKKPRCKRAGRLALEKAARMGQEYGLDSG